MRLRHVSVAAAALAALGGAGAFLLSPGPGLPPGTLIFTQVPVDQVEAGRVAEWRGDSPSRIVALDPTAGGEVRVLTEDFHAARAPVISYDGTRMLFAGRRDPGGPWQVWEMRLDGSEPRQVTAGAGRHTDPAYLPDGRIVFSGSPGPGGSGDREAAPALHTARLDGSGAGRISFHPEPDLAPTVLRDGRILFVSSVSPRSPTRPALLVARYDGTGAELFYAGEPGGRLIGRAWETGDGRVVFVESGPAGRGEGAVVAVSLRRPLRSREVLSAGVPGSFRSVYPLPSGKLVVSYRAPGSDRYALQEFDPEGGRLGRVLSDDVRFHAVEPVVVAERPDPRTFVSTVDTTRTTGALFGLDANLSVLPPAPTRRAPPRGSTLRVSGPEGPLGEVPLEADGSFYLELPADRPVRFETLNPAGEVVRGPSAWIWVRPNERRGCIGCHEDRELAPPNRVPLAIEKPPAGLTAGLARGTVSRPPQGMKP